MSSGLFILALILLILIYSLIKKVNAYETFLDGAKEGVSFTLQLFPFMLTFMLATTMLSNCGFLDIVNSSFNFKQWFFPGEIVLQGVIRPISSSSAMTIMIDIFDKFGVDSPAGIASTFIQNSTDTTLYVVTFYFGSVGIKDSKYAIKSGLLIDLFNFIVALMMTYLFLIK